MKRQLIYVLCAISSSLTGCSSEATPDDATSDETCYPAVEPYGTDSSKGESFPDLSFTACDGSKATLDAIRCGHKVTMLSVGAGWCEPCKDEAPQLQAAQVELDAAGDDAQIISVLFQDSDSQPATTLFCDLWVETFDLTMPVYIDPVGNTLDYFELAQTPLNVVMDRDGKVLWTGTGIPTDITGTIRSYL